MAPITKTITWAALVAIVSARPFLGARQQAPEMVTETDWVTVDVPVTLWVDQNGTPLSTVAQGGNFAAMQTTSTTSVAPIASSASASVSSAAPIVTSTTSAASVSPMAPVQTPAPSSSSVSTTTYVPPTTYVPTTLIATTSSQYQQGRQATTSTAAAVASSPAAAAGGNTGSVAVSASTTNTCEGTGAACVGDITYYDGGLGACGWNIDTNTDMQLALPYEFMGTESNDNPYCGRSLTIQNPTTGKTVTATVGDKCMGCTGRSIDLTEVLFTAIGNGCDGRCSGFEWWFN